MVQRGVDLEIFHGPLLVTLKGGAVVEAAPGVSCIIRPTDGWPLGRAGGRRRKRFANPSENNCGSILPRAQVRHSMPLTSLVSATSAGVANYFNGLGTSAP